MDEYQVQKLFMPFLGSKQPLANYAQVGVNPRLNLPFDYL